MYKVLLLHKNFIHISTNTLCNGETLHLSLHNNEIFGRIHTTSPSTRVRTRSPISGEMSEPNCCNVVKNLFSLESCRAPQAGGNC
jgi:hypothetical protein